MFNVTLRHCGKALRITYFCVGVALLIQHATCMCHIICSLSGFTTSFDIFKCFLKKVTEHKVCVLIFSATFI
jgi:hypothetical protein